MSVKKPTKLIVAIALCLAVLSCDNVSKDPIFYFDEAIAYESKNRLRAAVISLKNALQADPKFVDARTKLGYIYLQIGDGPSAEKEFSKARKLVKNNEEIELGYARSLLLRGKINEIVNEVTPNTNYSKDTQAEILTILGSAKERVGKNIEAIADIDQAIKISPSNRVVKLAIVQRYVSKNDYDGAMEKVVALTEEMPNYKRAWFAKGMLEISRGKAADAEESFLKVITLSGDEWMTPLRFNSNVNYLKSLFMQNKLVDARVKVDELKSIISKNVMLSYFDGVLLFKKKDYMNAKLRFSFVVKNASAYMPGQLMMGATLYALNNYEQADSYLSRFINKVPTHVQARKLLAATRLKQHRPNKALEVLSPLVKSNAEDEQLLAMVGKVSISSGAIKKGTEYLKKALKVSPENNVIRAELANAYMIQGAIDPAIEELQRIKDDDFQKRDVMLIVANLKKRNISAARKISKTLIDKTPTARTYFLAGNVELVDGARAAALNYFSKALQLEENFIPALLGSAQIAFENDELAKAETYYLRVIKQDAGKLSALLGLAILAGRRSEAKKAIEYVNTAKDNNPTAVRPIIILSKFYLRTGQYDNALTVVDEFMATTKNDQKSLRIAARVKFELKKYEDSLRTYSQLLILEPKSSGLHIDISKVHIAMDNITEARVSLKKALKLSPKNIVAKATLAKLEINEKNYAIATRLARQLKSDNKKSNVGYQVLGDIFLVQNRLKKAIQEYKKGKKRQLNKAIVLRLSVAYQKAKKYKSSVRELSSWLRNSPSDISVRMMLSVAQQKTGDNNGAINSLQKILASRPNHVPSINNLAWLYFMDKNVKALELSKKAYTLAPENGAVADTYGWVLLNMGDDKATALDVLKNADKKLPASMEVHYHLAVAYLKTGDVVAARKLLEEVVRSGKDFPDFEQAKKLYKTL